MKLNKTTKILLGAITLGLFLNASNLFIDKAYANDCASSEFLIKASDLLQGEIARSTNFLHVEMYKTQRNIIECIKFDVTCLAHLN